MPASALHVENVKTTCLLLLAEGKQDIMRISGKMLREEWNTSNVFIALTYVRSIGSIGR